MVTKKDMLHQHYGVMMQVRLVFSGAVQSGESDGGAASAVPWGLSRSTGSNNFEEDTGTQAGKARTVIRTLETVVQEQTTEISQICGCAPPCDMSEQCVCRSSHALLWMTVILSSIRANAEEIAQSMLELGGMAGGAAEVRGGLADADAGLQAVGAQYGQRLVELQELRVTQANMAATRQVTRAEELGILLQAMVDSEMYRLRKGLRMAPSHVPKYVFSRQWQHPTAVPQSRASSITSMVCPQQAVAEAKQLLGLCCTAAELMKSGQLFRAHQALARIRTEHFKEWDVSAEKARCTPAAAPALFSAAHCHTSVAEGRYSACSCYLVTLMSYFW